MSWGVSPPPPLSVSRGTVFPTPGGAAGGPPGRGGGGGRRVGRAVGGGVPALWVGGGAPCIAPTRDRGRSRENAATSPGRVWGVRVRVCPLRPRARPAGTHTPSTGGPVGTETVPFWTQPCHPASCKVGGGGGRRVPGQPDAMLRGDAAGMGDGQGETAGTQPGYRPGVTVGSGAPTSSTATSAGPWLPKLLPVRFKRRWPLKANAPPTEATVWLPAWKIPVSWDARNKNRLFEPRLLGGSPFGDSPFTLTETQRKNLSVNRIVQRAPCAPGRVRPPPLGSRRPCTPGEAVA